MRKVQESSMVVLLETKAYGEESEEEPCEPRGAYYQHQTSQQEWDECEELELVGEQQRQHEPLQLLEVLQLQVLLGLLLDPLRLLYRDRLGVVVVCKQIN